jgi:POT family proton-dependent oligopeptide transporter
LQLTYFILGELCISRVVVVCGKLVPAAWIELCFGVYSSDGGINWRLMGGMIETITAQYSLSTFFLILQ